MPSWHAILVAGVAFGFAAYFKLLLSGLGDRPDGLDEADSRIARLKRGRMERGACIYCGVQLPDGKVARTLTGSVCAQCGPDVSF